MLDWLKPILGDGYNEEIDNKIAAEINKGFVAKADYDSVLRVYNRKSMVSETNVGSLTGGPGNDLRSYSNDTIAILRAGGREACEIARAIRRCFGVDTTNVK